MIWYKQKNVILNAITNKIVNINKEQNIIANKKLNTTADKVVNADKRWNSIVNKK